MNDEEDLSKYPRNASVPEHGAHSLKRSETSTKPFLRSFYYRDDQSSEVNDLLSMFSLLDVEVFSEATTDVNKKIITLRFPSTEIFDRFCEYWSRL